MKRNMLRLSAVIGLLFATSVLVLPAQAQQNKPQLPNLVRKANNALQASAINRVEALYPPGALMARAIGAVIVEVTIDEGGSVTSARALSGHTLLRDAAVDAARGWTFKPTNLQGKPVKVVGTLTFTFNLPEYILRDRTVERLKRQVSLSPENSKLYYQLGRAYEDNQQDGEALKAYARAAAINPNYGDAHVALGRLNMKLNHDNEALRAYAQAVLLKLTPEIKAAVYRDTALIYFRRDQFPDAVEPFKQAIALAPEGSMYFKLGLTYLKLGDRASAMEQYRLLKDRNSILAEQLLNQINEVQ